MSAAALHHPTRHRGPAQARVVVLLLGLAVAAWVLTDRRMSGMDAGPGTELGGVGWFAVSWTLMMAAMMLPAGAPMVAPVCPPPAGGGGGAPLAPRHPPAGASPRPLGLPPVRGGSPPLL